MKYLVFIKKIPMKLMYNLLNISKLDLNYTTKGI